jgi:FkbM family methyltransferase
MTRSNLVRRTYRAVLPIPGVGGVLRKLAHACMPGGSRLWVCIPQGLGEGLWMYADMRVELGYARGQHQPWMQDLLKAELKPGDCFYDLGAHSGFFSPIAGRQVGPSCAVLAVEADPENAEIVRANVARNNWQQVTVLESAVWSASGQVSFAPASEPTQGHVSTGQPNGLRSVSAVSLDDMVFRDGHRPPSLIKMDVEGAEWDVLQGARRVLAEATPKLLCEIHHPAQSGDIQALLPGYGYRSQEWEPVDPHYPDYHQLYIWAVKRA